MTDYNEASAALNEMQAEQEGAIQNRQRCIRLSAENDLYRGMLRQIYLTLEFRGAAGISEIMAMTREYAPTQCNCDVHGVTVSHKTGG